MPYLAAGASVNLLLGYKESEPIYPMTYQAYYEGMRRVNLSLLTAVGTEVRFSPRLSGFVELTYRPDISSAFKSNLLTIRNSLFALQMGVKVNKKRKEEVN